MTVDPINPPSASVPALLASLSGPDETIALEAAKSLARLAAPEAVEPLLHLLHCGDTVTRREIAAYALRDFSDARAVGPLLATLQDTAEHPRVRGMAAESLGQLQDPRAVEPLIAALADAEVEVRFWAAFALGTLGDPAAIVALRRLAATDLTTLEGWWPLRQEALDAITHIENHQRWLVEDAK
jgi:HEAT repeat protein